jgi:hypothetical protein
VFQCARKLSQLVLCYFFTSIFDEVPKNKSIPMGSALFEIGEVLGARGNIKAKKLKNGGTLFVRITIASEAQYGTFHLALRGIKLKNVDGMFSKSDPFVVVSAQSDSAGGRVWAPVYRSECIKNNLNPVWKEFSIPVEKLGSGDKNTPIQIEVYDWEKSGKHQAMGKFQTSINGLVSAQVMGGAGDAKSVPLTGALNLMHKGKSYGKIVVTKAVVTGGNLNPVQGATAASMATGQAQNGTPQKFVKINGVTKMNPEYKKWKTAQASSPPTAAAAAVPAMPPPVRQTSLPPPIPPPPVTSNSPGVKPKFVDYLSGGIEINLVVAIDYTGSNGDPRKPGTLHYIHPNGQMNDYEKALTAVGSIVARYDSDQMFPVLGFGAKYGGLIQHCFQVGKAPELEGVSGMMEGYRGVFKTGPTMSGPTVFAEVIQFAAAQARSKQEANSAVGKQAYTILLILTDGAVTDIEQTKTAIRNASTAPLSIVIVGVGHANFSTMQFLDDFQRDEGGLTRDIVQFVELNRHAHSRENLTRETLDEIPDQLVNYFHSNGIMPLRPVTGSKLNIFEEDYNVDEDIDLGMHVTSEGEIRLEDPAKATWDGQSYGTASSFLPPAMAPHAQPSMQQSVYTPSAPAAPYGGQPPSIYGAQPPSIYGRQQPPSYGAPPPGGRIHIQAPSNSYPGMQLQVKNPANGQLQIVTIPHGVAPGSTFAVQL